MYTLDMAHAYDTRYLEKPRHFANNNLKSIKLELWYRSNSSFDIGLLVVSVFCFFSGCVLLVVFVFACVFFFFLLFLLFSPPALLVVAGKSVVFTLSM